MNDKRGNFVAKKAVLYKIHDYLTDKKVLGNITQEEKEQLKEVRSALESNERELTKFYESKIADYQSILERMEKIEQSI